MNKSKKISSVCFAAALLITVLSGCSDKNENGEQAWLSAETISNNYIAKDTDTIVTGEVISIVGNEVTLALGTAKGSADGEKPSSSEDADNTPSSEDDLHGKGKGNRPDFGGGEMPDMENGGTPPDINGEMPDLEGGEKGKGVGRRSNVSLEKSGEQAVYYLPAGMPITGLSGRNTDYSGVTEGMILTLTVNEDGIVCAAKSE
ncbi:MAG: hypothetical protein ACI4JJ_08770 [Huintestinicola sp.]